jgi:hypothetical protein
MKIRFKIWHTLAFTFLVALVLSIPSLYRQWLFRLPQASNWIDGSIRVIDAQTLAPVSDIQVDLTLLGEFGGDGGFDPYISDDRGIVQFSYNGPAMFHVRLIPPEGSIYKETSFNSEATMLYLMEDGTYFPSQFRIPRK